MRPMTHDTPTSNHPLSGRVIFRAGIALVMLGMLFLFRYSIEQGWFGPLARLTLGAVASAAFVVTGIIVSRKVYGRLLQGAGVAGGYATAWAAHGRYDLVDETTALVQMLAVAVVGVALAWREKSDVLSALGMTGAVAAPLLVAGEFVSPAGQVLHLVVVLAVAAFLYLVRSWWVTLAVTVAGAGLVLAAGTLFENRPPILLVAVAAWWLAGWALPVIADRVGHTKLSGEMVTVATIPIPAAAWGMTWLVVDGNSAIVAPLAAGLAVLHGALWYSEPDRTDSVIHLLGGLGFSGLALLSRFDVDVAVPLYLLVTLAVAVHGSRYGNDVSLVVGSAAAALAIPVWLLILDEGGPFTLAEATRDLASVLLVVAAAFLMRPPVRVGAGVTGFAMSLVWISRYPGELDPGWATAGFALLGIGSLVVGRLNSSRLLTGVGLGTVAMAVAKLILVDLASADPLLRIGLAFGIGLALLGVGYWVGDSALLTGKGDEESSPVEDEDVPVA